MQGHGAHATRQCLGLGRQLQLPVLGAAGGLQPVAALQGSKVTGQHRTETGLQIGQLWNTLQREHAWWLAGAGNADLALGNRGGFGIGRTYLSNQRAGIRATVLAFDPQRLLQQRRATQFEEAGLAGCRLRQLPQYPRRIDAIGQRRATEQQARQQAQQWAQGLGNARNHRN